jgi:uncharacterized cupin superfamily protein
VTSAADPDIAVTTLQRTGDERFQSLRRELGVRSFGMNLMRLAPRQRGRIHAHDHQEEVYLVLEGELTLVIEGTEHVLGPDQLARVGATVRHQLVNAGSERLTLLALGGAGDHVGRDGHAWAGWDETGAGKPPQQIPLPEDLPAA